MWVPERKEDMSTMNRMFKLYREHSLVAQLDKREPGFGFVHSSKGRDRREHCVADISRQ